MSNLLPPQVIQNRRWQRRVRRGVTFAGMALLGITIMAAALIPVYVYTKVVSSELEKTEVAVAQQTVNKEEKSTGTQRQELIKRLRAEKDLITTIHMQTQLPQQKEMLEKAAGIIMNLAGVSTQSISMQSSLDDAIMQFILQGTAMSRSAVVDTKNAFADSPLFTVTDFPISNLTPRQGNYNFTIHIATSNEKNNE